MKVVKTLAGDIDSEAERNHRKKLTHLLRSRMGDPRHRNLSVTLTREEAAMILDLLTMESKV